MYGLIGIVIFVLDIVAIVDCVRSALDSGKKVLWVLLILVLPILGMVLYFLVGKNRSPVEKSKNRAAPKRAGLK